MKDQIKPLTSLRFFFCLMVFFCHINFLNNSENLFLLTISKNIFSEGYIGVSFFFILSGFILSYNYLDKFRSNQITHKVFFISRFSRIYPLYILTFLISLPLVIKTILSNPFEYFILSIIHLSLLQSFIPLIGVYFNFNSPSWSISDEMFFYLMTPFLFSVLLYSKNKIISIILTLITLLFLGMFFVPVKYHHSIFYINPFVRILDFILGILIFLLFKRIKTIEIPKWHMNCLEFCSIIIFILFFIYHNNIPHVYRFSIYYWIPISLIILIFSFEKGIVSKTLSNKIILYLGEISFGFYMIHQLVIRYYVIIINKIGFQESFINNTVIIFIITLILSIISFEIFEKRFSVLIKSKFLNPDSRISINRQKVRST